MCRSTSVSSTSPQHNMWTQRHFALHMTVGGVVGQERSTGSMCSKYKSALYHCRVWLTVPLCSTLAPCSISIFSRGRWPSCAAYITGVNDYRREQSSSNHNHKTPACIQHGSMQCVCSTLVTIACTCQILQYTCYPNKTESCFSTTIDPRHVVWEGNKKSTTVGTPLFHTSHACNCQTRMG